MNKQFTRGQLGCIEQHLENIEYYKSNIEQELIALRNHARSMKQQLKVKE